LFVVCLIGDKLYTLMYQPLVAVQLAYMSPWAASRLMSWPEPFTDQTA